MRIFLVATLLSLASGAIFEGTPEPRGSGWAFLGKFVFDTTPENQPEAGLFKATFTLKEGVVGSGITDVTVLLFSDEDNSWGRIQANPEMPCREVQLLSKNYDRLESATLSFSSSDTWPYEARINQTARKRYWFAALAHCTGNGPAIYEGIHYRTEWINNHASGWNQQLGSNQQGLQTLYLVIFLIFFPFVIVHFIGVIKLSQKLEFVHPLVRLFGLVVFLQLVTILSNLSYWGAYVNNGQGLSGALQAGELVDVFNRSLFVLILMLMSKGWTISGEELSGQKFMIVVVVVLLVSNLLIVIWKYAVADPIYVYVGTAIKVFEFIILGIWLLFALWFAKSVWTQHRSEDNPAKKGIYRNLGLVYIPWFFGLPLVTLLTFWLDPWLAEFYIKSVNICITVIGYMVLSFLMWPSRAEEYFTISSPDVMKAQIDTYEQL